MPNIIFVPHERGLLPGDTAESGKYQRWFAKYRQRAGRSPFRLNLPGEKRSLRTNNAWHGDFSMLAEIFSVSPAWIKHESKKLCPEIFLIEIPSRIPEHPSYDLKSSSLLTQDEASIWTQTYREHWQAIANQMFGLTEIVWYKDLQKEAEYWGEVY